jgi:ubiquinol-cytochrome c reductase iron-sulfur subunit
VSEIVSSESSSVYDADGPNEVVLPNGRFAPAPLPHELRRADIDPKAAKRAERQVANLFILAMLMALLFIVAYVAVDKDTVIALPVVGTMSLSNLLLGLTFGLSVFCIGAGAIHWAKKLMPDVEVVQSRHDMASSEQDRAEAVEIFQVGADESGFGSRTIIRRTLLGALALFPIPLIVILRDLWVTPPDSPSPSALLKETIWADGVRLVVDGTNRPIKPSDVPVGGLVNIIPANLEEVQKAEGNLNARAKASSLLIRMRPEEIRSQQGGTTEEPWDYQGILAFSKICTHVGCPISLYQQRTHHLLCPCHQSTFDLADSAKVVFGPAARRMPQLAITVDSEGYLVARHDFTEHVGPSFWEQGS